jgi:tRNA-dihydrouridine synthase
VPERPSLDERRATILRHIDLYVESFDEDRMCREIRKHLLWYFRGTPGEKILRRHLAGLESVEDVVAALDLAIVANEGIDEIAAKSHPRGKEIALA